MRSPIDYGMEKEHDLHSTMKNGVSPEEIRNLAEVHWRQSPEVASAFLKAALSTSLSLSREEFERWVDKGCEMTKRSFPAAADYFLTTHTFLQYGKAVYLGAWAEGAMEILETGQASEEAAIFFLRSSAELLRFMPFGELREWRIAGVDIARRSSRLAAAYFLSIPDGFDTLYANERFKVCQFGSLLAKTHPESALEIFRRFPEILLRLSPSVRTMVLDATHEISSNRPEMVARTFYEIAEGLRTLPYPAQETVMNHQAALGKISTVAAKAFLDHVNLILEEIPEALLSHWIEAGISELLVSERKGINYFSLDSEESLRERLKWKEAILLEDCRQFLSLFAHALSGKELEIKSTEELGPDDRSGVRNYPTSDGYRIYLPPFVAMEQAREENLRDYKVAAAHQAGYLQWGTFDGGLSIILPMLESLPLKDLALDIFFILEDGRIDRRLRREYRGLARDMDLVLSRAMDKRPSLSILPLQEALVEFLLRLTVDPVDGKAFPLAISTHAGFIKEALEGFYEHAGGVWDCFSWALVIYDYISQLPGGGSYTPSLPLLFRGRLRPDLLPKPGPGGTIPAEPMADMVMEGGAARMPQGAFEAFLERARNRPGLDFLEGEGLSGKGLFITDRDEVTAKGANKDRGTCSKKPAGPVALSSRSSSAGQEGPYYYDEWDYLAKSYRRRWCRLFERTVDPESSGIVDEIYARHDSLIRKVRKQFQRIRPEIRERVPRVEWGDEINLHAMVQGVVERKAGLSPSEKIFVRHDRKIRRISTLFLVDMSASTDELVPCSDRKGKKVIDIEIESLVVIMEALEALADEYAISGFSGYGRERVDFFRIKDFSDTYSESLKRRIGGIRPKQSTRMGPAIRHGIERLRPVESDQRILLLLSDGFPQDHDYGEDRRSNEYGLHDTMMAFLEAKRAGIRPFCITVDQSGNDYLRRMCDPRSYLVIQDIHSLPEILPNILKSLII